MQNAAFDDDLAGLELVQCFLERSLVEACDLRKKAAIEFPAYYGGNLRDLLGSTLYIMQRSKVLVSSA
ncbi:hypothetical protein LPB79_01015 (plasmid) [Rhizobium sp. T136]|uniref:hypothetical protein n=1 Tax=Rhizobium sp. T136 TaxID=555319 RepID=UPI0003FB4E8C|nr:hypothetical protein [Rhizobium sp. T136]UFS79936.1 hypothetical protein LPB79_01015 [Rhizobium sp. T136]